MYIAINDETGDAFVSMTIGYIADMFDVKECAIYGAMKKGCRCHGYRIKEVSSDSKEVEEAREIERKKALEKQKDEMKLYKHITGEVTEVIEQTGYKKFIIHGRFTGMTKHNELANLQVVAEYRTKSGLRTLVCRGKKYDGNKIN